MIDDDLVRIRKGKRVSVVVVVVVVVVVQESTDFTSGVVRFKIFIAKFWFGAPTTTNAKCTTNTYPAVIKLNVQ